jgi:hypothetical protein
LERKAVNVLYVAMYGQSVTSDRDKT